MKPLAKCVECAKPIQEDNRVSSFCGDLHSECEEVHQQHCDADKED